MKCDILFAGVGGQGVLSMAAIIGRAALASGLHAKQSEVHGMAQRGGAVHAQLRLSDRAIASELIPLGTADLVLSLEPLESLRYAAWLSPGGSIVTSVCPVANFANYPEIGPVLERIARIPRSIRVDADALAIECGDIQSVNTVMVGAASHVLPLDLDVLERAVEDTFRSKSEWVREVNRKAFRAGRIAADEVAGGVR